MKGIFDLESISVFAGALGPAFAFVLAITIDRRKRAKIERPPQEEKLLRPAGYSLSLRLDLLQDQMLEKILWASLWTAFAGGMTAFTALLIANHAVFICVLVSGSLLAMAAFSGTVLALQAFRRVREAQNVRLGMRGEQAVAEALHSISEAGYRIFHDLEAGVDWNIDHVAVGTTGVFLVETKARRRRVLAKTGPNHVVRCENKILLFPWGRDIQTVPQAERNANWLSDYLSKKTGEPIQVEPLIVIPGWYVETGKNVQVRVMNCCYMAKYLRRRPEVLLPPQVRRIITALEEKCRTLEF
jgi:hypothetical protein